MKELEHFRSQIDAVDEHIIDLIKQRQEISSNIGVVKQTCKMDILQPDREKEKMQHIAHVASEKGVAEDVVKKLFVVLLEHSKSLQ